MAPIDYSKWDNIDTDSEPETSSPAAAPKATLPPAPASLLSSISTSMATDGASAPIQAVVVRCEAEKVKDPPWSTTRIPANHDVFSRTVPPVPGLIEVPLVLHQLGTRSANRADLDNQIATYLNINPDSGFAPPAWQSHVGTIIVARKDRKPLLPQHLEGVWIYCDHILDLFGEGGGAPRWLYNRQAFGKWWAGYCEEQKEFRLGKGGEEDPDDWQAVRSPYEI
ncbi:uncharacterized protein N7473_004338 [Penicillium subrubescens]|uniref:Ectomycorrhiza-upregulated zf-mynd domain-containing protein n=1 Tax=Penicillium subrubescens TaxID=1316194 RepID=A0A1Q5TNA0_9EURO|nr:uncharacterized protein N7473_004338 [Penicillium subrubescens]KAJ5900268.1 hypothetical protein N7473_004338 [Penicillium subrubescens]OKP01706.1 hypothetical protein PENSUB_7244 [Penicillium subrubescens]